jgi:protein arginine kinase
VALPFIRYSSFWRQEGDFQDILLSSVLEMRRNLDAYPFRDRMSADNRDSLLGSCTKHVYALRPLEDGSSDDFALDLPLFCEQALIPSESGPFDAGVLVGDQCAVAIGGAAHICICHAFSDGKFYSAFNVIDQLDDRVGECGAYAFGRSRGFLFENPADCGTGFSARSLLHLPALAMSNAHDEIRSVCAEYEIAVSSFSAGPSLPLFVISTKNIPGDSEQDFCANILGAVTALARMERDARDNHYQKYRLQLEDLAWRSYGLLRNARMISWNEAAEYLFNMRLGAILPILDSVRPSQISRLVFETTDIFLRRFCGDDTASDHIVRAEMIRRALNKEQ